MGFEYSALRVNNEERAYMPHCDSSILHAPGECEYCDKYPDWQHYRQVARIAFSGPQDLGTEDLAPCPSTYFRSPEVRDIWGGNVASKKGEGSGWVKNILGWK